MFVRYDTVVINTYIIGMILNQTNKIPNSVKCIREEPSYQQNSKTTSISLATKRAQENSNEKKTVSAAPK